MFYLAVFHPGKILNHGDVDLKAKAVSTTLRLNLMVQ